MKNLSRILWGIVLVLLGLIWGLNATGIADINIFFDGWWTLFIIIPSLLGLIDPKNKGKTGCIIGLVIGVLLLLSCQNIIDTEVIWELILPIIVVLIGLSLIFGTKDKWGITNKTKILEEDDAESYFATFGEQKISKSGEKFKGANLDAIFGSVVLDLREAKLENEAVIRTSAIFGGVEIDVPKDVVVRVKATQIFGGVNNSRKDVEAKKVIYIEGLCLFGGVDIK